MSFSHLAGKETFTRLLLPFSLADLMNFHRLKSAVGDWTQRGIISPGQANQILALYEHDVPVYKTMRFWLMSLAVSLLGFALFLVISANWQKFPWAVQSSIALLPLIAAQGFAVRAEMRDQELNAHLGWFAASIALGANIMLQAQIFHISAYYPNGVLFWVIGMVPVLWWRPATISYLLASALFITYMTMQTEYRQFSVVALVPLLALSRVAILRQNAINTVALLLMCYTFSAMLMVYRGIKHPGLLWELSFLTLALALIQRFRDLRDSSFNVLLLLASLGFHLIALVATFKDGARWLAGKDTVWLAIALAALSGTALFQMRRSLRENRLTLITAGGIAALTIFAIIGHAAESAANGDGYLILRIGANAAYLGSLVALIFHGIESRSKRLFLAAAAGLLLWTWIRYLDLFHDYLVTALIFALSAGALAALNRLWEKKYEK